MNKTRGSLLAKKLQFTNKPSCGNGITFHKAFEENLFIVLAIYKGILGVS